MTYFHTCVGCEKQKAECPVRDGFKAAMRGHGVMSIRHRCPSRNPMYVPGQHVQVLTAAWLGAKSDWDDEPPQCWFPAVFVKQLGPKALAFIKPGETGLGEGYYEFETTGGGYVKVPLSRIQIVQTSKLVDMTGCQCCGRIPALGETCGQPGHSIFGPPLPCLLRERAEATGEPIGRGK